jgi:predicted Zn-dependent peptidase
MLFKGSLNYSYKKIKREIEGRGGILNGFTSQEITAYYAHFLKKNTLITLDILLDMVLNPLLIPREIDKERSVILEELKMYNDLPLSRAKTILDNILWQDHPLGQDIIGYSQTVRNIKKKDLMDFKNRFYIASNIVISFCGDFSLEKIKKLIENRIKKSDLKKKNVYQKKPDKQRGVKIKIEKKEIQQLHLCLGFRSIPYSHKKKNIQQLLHVILGANMSSRLFENLREKKSLCYDISTELKYFKDSGAFVIRLALDKEKINLAVSTIKKEIEKIKKQDIQKKEFIRAKDYFLGQLAMSLEQPQGRMFYSAQNYIKLSKIEKLDQVKDQIKAIKPYQIRDFSNKLFNFSNLCVSIVGNVEAQSADQIRRILSGKH